MEKKSLCANCAKCKSVDKDGFIRCPFVKTKADARKKGMNIFLHCYASCYQPRA